MRGVQHSLEQHFSQLSEVIRNVESEWNLYNPQQFKQWQGSVAKRWPVLFVVVYRGNSEWCHRVKERGLPCSASRTVSRYFDKLLRTQGKCDTTQAVISKGKETLMMSEDTEERWKEHWGTSESCGHALLWKGSPKKQLVGLDPYL